MELIKQSIEVLTNVDEIEVLQLIETAGRTAYKSEDKITLTSASKFVKMLMKRGHLSVLEHYSITVRLVTNRAIANEIVRHRIASYTQECITGDTLIKSSNSKVHNETIEELYNKQERDFYGKSAIRRKNIYSIDKNNNIVKNKSIKIFKKGLNKVYEVTTKNGYKIKATMNHKFKTDKGFKKLSDISVGDNLFVNGRKKLLNDKDVLKLYLVDKYNPNEIAEMYNCNRNTVTAILKIHNVFVKHKNDKNKEKYNKNHTEETYKKSSVTAKNNYKNGRVVWNKNLTASTDIRVKQLSDTLKRLGHRPPHNGCGELNSNFKNGSNINYYTKLKANIIRCEICNKESKAFEVHHIDKNRKNNKLSNLKKLCRSCHKAVHSGWYVKTDIYLDEVLSIVELGLKETYDIEMRGDNHNYIANGFVVHNSTRYVNYVKKSDDGGIKFIMNTELYNDTSFEGHMKFELMHLGYQESEKNYNELIQLGVKPEVARDVLPLGLATEIVTTMNLRSWLHFFELRCHKTAHPQMRELANMIKKEFQEVLPVVFGKSVGTLWLEDEENQ